MKNPYKTLMDEIHVPTGWNERVLAAARQEPVQVRRTHPWFRTVVCAACALLLVVGTVHFATPETPTEGSPSSTVPLPRWEFTLTACAVDAAPHTTPSDLSFTVEQSGAAEGCCLFQIESESAVSLQLSMQQGDLYVVQEDGSLAPLDQTGEKAPLSPQKRFGFRLTDTVGLLSVEVLFPDGSTSCKTYALIAETSETTSKTDPLHTPLFYHDARPASQRVYAIDAAERRQLLWPLDTTEKQITTPFGTSNPISNYFHAGIDIAAPTGTSILAAADGTVVEIGMDEVDGRYLVLDHGNGLRTCYHSCSVLMVELDTQVKAGEKIAEVGSSGRSTGPHLHFEVQENGSPKDPKLYFSWETIGELK